MTLVQDVEHRLNALKSIRRPFEPIWREISDYVALHRGTELGSVSSISGQPLARDKAKRVFDATAQIGHKMLSAGVESLVTPKGQMWHGLGLDDALASEATDEETEFFESLSKFLFSLRYSYQSDFPLANEVSILDASGFGTGVTFIEESFSHATPIRYKNIPLFEAFLDVDAYGRHDTLYREFSFSARQMVQKFGDKCHGSVLTAAQDDKDKDKRFNLVHSVQPQTDKKLSQGFDFESVYIDLENKHVIGKGGFSMFPFMVDIWYGAGNSPYGQSPVMMLMSEIKQQQKLVELQLRNADTAINPAYALFGDNITQRIRRTPGALNPGLIDQQGRALFKSMHDPRNLNEIVPLIEMGRQTINEGLHLNLFQALADHPNMTATEVLLRNQQKADMLGPIGNRIESARAHMVDREIAILEGKGLFRDTMPPPESLAERNFNAVFTSPFQKMRASSEANGVHTTLAAAMQMAEAEPDVIAKIDFVGALEIIHSVSGAPQKMLHTEKEFEAEVESRRERQEAQQGLNAAEQMARVAKDAGPALQLVSGQ